MSHFICEKCGTVCYDAGRAGYTTGCEHYPLPYREKTLPPLTDKSEVWTQEMVDRFTQEGNAMYEKYTSGSK